MRRWCIVLVLVGCRDKASPPPPSPSPPMPPPVAPADAPSPTTLAVLGTRVPYGKAYPSSMGKLEIRLTDVDAPCGDGFPPPWQKIVTIDVPAGPGGRFFVGAPFGTTVVAGDREVGINSYAPQAAKVTLEPFERTPGTKLRGTLELFEIQGSFEAELCPGNYDKLVALPADAPATPIAKHARIRIDKHSEKYRQIGAVMLYDDNPRCSGDAPLVITDIGGTSTQALLAGSPQPAQFRTDKDHGLAWVSLDELHFEAGKKLRGRIVTPTRAGVFEAEICPY